MRGGFPICAASVFLTLFDNHQRLRVVFPLCRFMPKSPCTEKYIQVTLNRTGVAAKCWLNCTEGLNTRERGEKATCPDSVLPFQPGRHESRTGRIVGEEVTREMRA